MNDERVLKLALSCYPRWWRERYGDEVSVHATDMVADGRSPLTLSLSLMLGAARARWSARGMPRDYRLWSMRNRVSIAGATLTWLLVAPIAAITPGNQTVGLRFSSMAQPYRLPMLLPTAPAARIVTYSSAIMAIVAFITILLLIAGWSHLIGGIRRSGGQRQSRTLWLAWVPGIAFLVCLAAAIIDWTVLRPSSVMISGRDHHITYLNGHPATAHIFGIALIGISVVGWLLSIVCIAVVAKRSEVDPSELRFGTGLSTAVAALFALLLAAYVVWGFGLTLEAKQAAHGGFNTVTYSRQSLWIPMAVLLCLAVAVSIVSARTARRSWNVLAGGWS
jgi:type IV secretory pathway TrbD component